MSVSENIRALAREGLKVSEIASRLGIRYQHAYNVLKQSRASSLAAQDDQGKASVDLTDALVLVSCVSQKLSRPAPAQLLYRSEWFLKVRKLGLVDKGYPEFDCGDGDETEVRFLALVVACGDASPVLELVEEALDQIAPLVFLGIVRRRVLAVSLGGDDGLDLGLRQLLANSVGIVALVGQQRFDLVGDHPQQWREALDVVCLSARQDEAERAAFGVTAGMELGGEAATRSTKRLCLLSPFFIPTAQ